jgi:hypothetical protein
MNTWTDQDIDNLIVSVEETIKKAEVLAKSSLKKDAGPDQEMPPQEAAPADQEAPPAEAPAPADAQAAGEAPAPEAPPQEAAPAESEQALEGEEEAPLSDEELSQIYGSMPPEELERHYSVIRQQLQAAYGEEAPAEGQEAAPAPEAQAEEAAPAPAEDESQEMGKSEAAIADLKKTIAAQGQALEQITKAFEVLTKPSRKSITEIAVLNKSESDSNESQPLTVEQIKAKAGKLKSSELTKSERESVNKFFLYGEGQEEVEKLIHSKGGK